MDIKEATIQELNLELIRRTNYNGFNGEYIYKSLINHPKLWEAVVIDSASYVFKSSFRSGETEVQCIELIKLRDLPQNIWNVDTLFILPQSGQATNLLNFAKRNWHPNETEIITGEKARIWLGVSGTPIVKLWWD